MTEEKTGMAKVMANLRKMIPIKTREQREKVKAEKELRQKVEEHQMKVASDPEYAKAFDLYKRVINEENKAIGDYYKPSECYKSDILPEIDSVAISRAKYGLVDRLPDTDIDSRQGMADVIALASFTKSPITQNPGVLKINKMQKSIGDEKQKAEGFLKEARENLSIAEQQLTPRASELQEKYKTEDLYKIQAEQFGHQQLGQQGMSIPVAMLALRMLNPENDSRIVTLKPLTPEEHENIAQKEQEAEQTIKNVTQSIMREMTGHKRNLDSMQFD